MAESDDLTAANSYIEAELRARLKRIEEQLNTDVLVCVLPIGEPVDTFIRDAVEEIEDRSGSLLVVLETDGGSIETTERIVDVLRHHYPTGEVSFLVPNFAMSAGTILVMSGDKIYMDYFSVLGPIDPQVPGSDGRLVPALGYLEKYKQMIRKSDKGGLSQAELALFLDRFDPAQLHSFEQAREHSVDLLKKWLVEHKFKDWTVTEGSGVTVTPEMKAERAKTIAGKLNNTKLWRSHGRGLSMEVVRRELNLKIEDFALDDELNKRVRSYYKLLKDYMVRRDYEIMIHSRQKMTAA